MRPAVVVLTGAGVSADSGVSTFRDAGGLWEEQRLEDVATPEAWARDPALVWRFYQLRRAQLAEVEPNPAHLALARLERALALAGAPFTLVSQNVDDLHARAGSSVLSMHGQLRVLACEACGRTLEDDAHLDPESFVPCSACGHPRLRPDVVWFGELPRFVDQVEVRLHEATHFLAVGTSGAVWPAAGFLGLARATGTRTFVNALEAPDNAGEVDHFLPGRAAEVIPGLVDTWIDEWGLSAHA